MDNNLIQLLESVGLKPKEAKVYLALLEIGRCTVSQIAKPSGLKRSIIYVILSDLIKSGYVSRLPDRKVNEYQALDPSLIIAGRKGALKNFIEMLPYFQTLRNKGKSRPRMHYIETKEGIWNTYEEMNYAKDAFFISAYEQINKCFPGGVEKWIKNYKKGFYPLIGRHLVPDDPEEIKIGKSFKEIKQKVKYLPGVKKFNMDFTIYENKLAITSLEEEPFMVLIESEVLVNSIKPIFEAAWGVGKPV